MDGAPGFRRFLKRTGGGWGIKQPSVHSDVVEVGMIPRLMIKLFDGWTQIENEGGPTTYVNGNSCLQFSQVQKKGEALPEDPEKLIGICEGLTRKVRGRRDMLSGAGKCELGIFGTVVAKGDSPAYVQVWVLSNENDFVLITHVCEAEPSPKEVAEAREIALRTMLGPTDSTTPKSTSHPIM